jgi:flagellar biosynthesis protein FliP
MKGRARLLAMATVIVALLLVIGPAAPALAQQPDPDQVNIDFGDLGSGQKPTQSVVIILALTVLSVGPSLLVMLTSFTRIVIVLSITRNALGLPTIPPNQVMVGLALFLSLFIMSPTLDAMNSKALQPFLKGDLNTGQAFRAAQAPLKQFMLKQTRQAELEVFIKASGKPRPKDMGAIDLSTLAPAFILSELRTAFVMGFVIFIPFLVIDLLISSTLMSMGLMMLPPVLISLPFKLLLFVMVDGWGLVVRSLVDSFR